MIQYDMRLYTAVFLNLIIICWMLYTILWLFRIHEPEKTLNEKMHIFRFFTFISNILSAVTATVMLIAELTLKTLTELPGWVMVFRFMGTASVAVTWLTVLVFLAPRLGRELLWKDDNLFMHTVGPLFTMLSFVFLENSIHFSLWYVWAGMLPMALYALLYFYKVILVGEEKGGWPDFYGFNMGGKWPVSLAAMICGTLLISLVLIALHNQFL